MAKDKKDSKGAVLLKESPETIERWDRAAKSLGMLRAQFVRYAANNIAQKLEEKND